LPSDAEREDMALCASFVEMQAATLLDALRDGRGTFLCVSVKYTTTYFYMYVYWLQVPHLPRKLPLAGEVWG